MQQDDILSFLLADVRENDVRENIGDFDPISMLSLIEEEEAIDSRHALAAASARASAEAALSLRRFKMQEIANQKSLRRKGPIEIPRSVGYLAIGTVVALLFWAANLMLTHYASIVQVAQHEPLPVRPRVELPIEPAIANVTKASLHAKWRLGKQGLHTSSNLALKAGRLALESGVLELSFNGGARIVLEAPAELELLSADRARIHRGKLVAHVPDEALGFTIFSGASAVVDLGTEFGIKASADGSSSIHVLDGEVALVTTTTPPENSSEEMAPKTSRKLTVGLARHISADGRQVREIKCEQASFIRSIPQSAYELAVLQSRPLAFWRFNERADSPELASQGRIDLPGVVGRGVVLGEPSARRPEPGNFAALFSGIHGGINLGPSAELALTESFTIEAWVLIPRLGRSPQRIVSTFCETPKSGYAFGATSQIFAKRQDYPGVMLHFTFYGVYDLIAPVPLEPGTWTHVAVTIGEEGLPTLYVDGLSVATELRDKGVGNFFRPLSGAWPTGFRGVRSSSPCYLGRNPPAADAVYPSEAWQGGIDELAIFNRPLTQEEIFEHYQAGLARSGLGTL